MQHSSCMLQPGQVRKVNVGYGNAANAHTQADVFSNINGRSAESPSPWPKDAVRVKSRQILGVSFSTVLG